MHRGPQAQAQPVPTPAYPGGPFHHAPNAALLIDFDNVTMGIRSDLGKELRNLLSSDIIKGKVAVQRAYADWRRYPQYIVPLAESSIDMIYAPAYGSSKKNATDIRLAIDALELVFTRPEIGTYILLSGDSDFSSLVIKLKEYGKYVIGVGIRESSSDLLVMNCDEYYSYNALAGLMKAGEEEVGPARKWDPWELVSEAIGRMKRNGDVMRSDRLKQVMQDVDPSFDEGNLGIAKFSRFVQEAAQRGLLAVTRLENGQLEVSPAHEMSAPNDATVAAVSGDTVSIRPAGDAPPDSPAEPRSGRRGRRGRGGRGRDREARTPREPREPREALAPAHNAAGLPIVEGGGAAGMSDPDTEMIASSHGDSLVPHVVEGDEIGTSGERLTREEAFRLVGRAVAALTRDAADAARASEVRRVARELLARDSESLSERNFTRILRDAHDADVIDLRRRGDDFEVARAADAAPVAEQLRTLDDATAAVASTLSQQSGPPRRVLGPRGIPGRGRGLGTRAASLPPGLLSIGLVTADSSVNRAAPPVAEPRPSGDGGSEAGVEVAPPAPKKRAVKKDVTDEGTRAATKARRARAKRPSGGKSP
ncbi:MAG: hypothetical protein NVS4B3_04320 [Gemmatimonadaceae bacterium]